jgi:hypothetical protein
VKPALTRLDVPHMLRTESPPFVGYVYLAGGDAGPLKIGFSKDPYTRVESFQCGNHQELRVIAKREGTPADEREIHERLKQHRVKGEWFDRWAALDEFNLPLDRTARQEIGAASTESPSEALRAFIRTQLEGLFVMIAEHELEQHIQAVRAERILEVCELQSRLGEVEDCLRAIASDALWGKGRDSLLLVVNYGRLSRDHRRVFTRYRPLEQLRAAWRS